MVGPKIVGFDHYHLLDPRHRVGGEPERVVRNDFGRQAADRFLKGHRAHWEVSYEFEHPQAEPWRRTTEQDLEQALLQTLEAAGLAGQVLSHNVEITAHPLARASIRVELDPSVGRDDRRLFDRLNAAWPHDRVALPAILLAIAVPEQEGPKQKRGLLGFDLLRSWFQRTSNGFLNVDPGQIGEAESKRLGAWARQAAPNGHKQSLTRQVLALLGADTNLGTESGRAALNAVADLQLFSPTWSEGIRFLERQFKVGTLGASEFLYNGHPTWAMTSLVPTLKAFGARAVHLWLSKRSGTGEALDLIGIQRPAGVYSERSIAAIRKEQRQSAPSVAQLMDRRLGVAVAEVEAGAKDRHLIVDKLGPWLETRGNAIPREVANGFVRAIVHNRDDLDAIAKMKALVWGVDFANSRVKKLEATFIGEQYALMGAREVRNKGWGRIGDVPVVINGFGLLGREAAEALVRLGLPRSRIEIRDNNPAVIAEAQALGFAVGTRPHERAVVLNATPGEGINAQNAGTFGSDLIVLSMTSGGKGVDLAGLRAAGPAVNVHTPRNGQIPIADLDFTLNHGGKKVLLRLIAEGQPPNLVDEMWADRYQMTSLGISAATLMAARLTKPGVVPFDPVVDEGLLSIAATTGLLRLRPLEARPGEDAEALRRDLEAFTPTPAPRG